MPGPDATSRTESATNPEVEPAAYPETEPWAAPHVSAPHQHAPPPGRPMHGREREYLLAVILTVLTLGVYHFYYHYKTHDELCLELGRPNDIKPLFVGYVVVMVGALVLPIVPLLFVAGLVLLALIVVRQYATIHEARRRLGLMPRGDATLFLLWDYLGAFILVGPFIAYYNMVHNYNDIWHALRHGAHLATDAEAGHGPGVAAGAPGRPYSGHPGIELGPAGNRGAGAADRGPIVGPPAAASPAMRPADFSVRRRHDTDPSAEGLTQQQFVCPRCETHVAVHGVPGERVAVRCGTCGETGEVQVGT